jgi:hypothetical protein
MEGVLKYDGEIQDTGHRAARRSALMKEVATIGLAWLVRRASSRNGRFYILARPK